MAYDTCIVALRDLYRMPSIQVAFLEAFSESKKNGMNDIYY